MKHVLKFLIQRQDKIMSKKELELEEINVILKIPKNTTKLKITTTILHEGEEQKVKKKLNQEDIIEARRDFLDNVEDGDHYDDLFVITDEGKRYLESLKNNNMEEE